LFREDKTEIRAWSRTLRPTVIVGKQRSIACALELLMRNIVVHNLAVEVSRRSRGNMISLWVLFVLYWSTFGSVPRQSFGFPFDPSAPGKIN
jgi:hypothetical protein